MSRDLFLGFAIVKNKKNRKNRRFFPKNRKNRRKIGKIGAAGQPGKEMTCILLNPFPHKTTKIHCNRSKLTGRLNIRL